jgi:hypothetical protein
MALGSALLVSAAPTAQAAPRILQFTSDVTNTLNEGTTLEHPALNGKPNLRMIVTQFAGPILNPHAVGLRYDYLSKRWQVFNEDYSSMPIGQKFNILLPQVSVPVVATPLNSNMTYTFFSLKKSKPDALLLFSHVATKVKGLRGVYLAKNQGLFYTGDMIPPTPGSSRWAIFNEDGSAPYAACYSVADVSRDPNAFVFTAQTGVNISFNGASISHPVSDNNPNAVVFVNHVWNPLGHTPNDLDHPLGVSYDPAANKWGVCLEDGSPMPDGATFNVCAFPSVTP